MKFSLLTLACLFSVALAVDTECKLSNGGAAGGPACGCNSNASCFCEKPSDDLSVASECSANGSCGCPSDENGHCDMLNEQPPPPPPRMF
ncbi:hypothetical protein CLAFUW4_03645 [Fulvia fulva]|uniref:Uncharacterized protein n=1 Tax=Passalora fulva TaxID=5499 RepID=A0A9Q8P514_PASFU|nr:uncharacterized protein CLAFUR5_03622 [Fulvia fulva]KAK4631485.1 hypothetical protein CLAFUR4_03633 [Fulvia fulva]KAK4632481.1 hypothetical protein CLAFUR0_03636 [Fulvia fulva]UJO13292.1 hypothetical protein CLAFUR5_03622 [Fulvia fulva]WPV11986.1 hypothetical protein CLAFUW4_03645 [Fulvia fulva]WPV26532.1 hypothetical protein CLAFUW7_03637 [Fulvia fulva]